MFFLRKIWGLEALFFFKNFIIFSAREPKSYYIYFIPKRGEEREKKKDDFLANSV